MTDTRSDPLQTAVVQIWTTSVAPGVVAVASTASDGTYAVAGLAAGTYNVCFEGNYATGGSSTTGYVEQCYRGVTWDGYSSGPIGATGVTVAAGAIASNIDASLSSGGVVTGTVTDTSSNPLQGVYVEIFTTGANPGVVAAALNCVRRDVHGCRPGCWNLQRMFRRQLRDWRQLNHRLRGAVL